MLKKDVRIGQRYMAYRAPWHRRFRTFYCAGSVAYEVQVGPLVVQWFYKRPTAFRPTLGRLHIWRDQFWNR